MVRRSSAGGVGAVSEKCLLVSGVPTDVDLGIQADNRLEGKGGKPGEPTPVLHAPQAGRVRDNVVTTLREMRYSGNVLTSRGQPGVE